jgi:hypothetical protein
MCVYENINAQLVLILLGLLEVKTKTKKIEKGYNPTMTNDRELGFDAALIKPYPPRNDVNELLNHIMDW